MSRDDLGVRVRPPVKCNYRLLGYLRKGRWEGGVRGLECANEMYEWEEMVTLLL